jgi:hypothetical protein
MAALEDKRIEVSLRAAAKSAQTLKHPTPGEDDGGNPDIRTPRPDKSVKDKELKDKKKREKPEKDKARQIKKPEPEVKS